MTQELFNSYKATSKTHSTMGEKLFISFYVEHIHFLLKRCCWIYSHYTFEQSKLKKDFVIMNQISRQNAKTSVEKDFYTLISNFQF